MIHHETTKRVRYGETDQMGYLYYGHYALYYEIGRVELLRSLGYTYAALEAEEGVMMPVLSLQCRFVRPARYDTLVTIRTELRRAPDRDITFHYELTDARGKLLNGGSTRLCFVRVSDGARVACPPPLARVVLPYFG